MRFWRLLLIGVAAGCILGMRLICWPPVPDHPNRVVGSIVLPYGTAEVLTIAPGLDYAYVACGVFDRVYRVSLADLSVTASIAAQGKNWWCAPVSATIRAGALQEAPPSVDLMKNMSVSSRPSR